MKRFVALVPIAVLLASGCGGSSNSTNNSPNALPNDPSRAATLPPPVNSESAAALSPLGLFVTASGTTTYDHLWVTVHKIEGLGSDEKPVTLYEDRDGTLIDLATLTKEPLGLVGAGHLGALPKILRLRISLAPTLQVIEAGQPVGKTVSLAAELPKNDIGDSVVTITLARPYSGDGPLVLGTDLAKFTVTDGKATLALERAEIAKETARATQTLSGSIQGQPTATGFTLALSGGRKVAVALSPATILHNAASTSNPTITDAQPTTVIGELALDGKTLTASRVLLGTTDSTSAEGAVADLNPAAGSFTLTPSSVSGVALSQRQLTVTLDETATFRSRGGLSLDRAAFLGALGEKGATLRVWGSYEPVTGALLARQLVFVGGSTHEANIGGVASFDEKSERYTIAKSTLWDGFTPTDKSTPIATSAATRYLDDKGEVLTPGLFREGLKTKTLVVVGLLGTDGTITATKLSLGAAIPVPAPTPTPTEVKPTESAKPDPKIAD